MKRIPRKLKKIAKKAVEYGSTNFSNFLRKENLPSHGVWFYIPANIKSNRKGRLVIKYGRKIMEAYYDGLFDS